MSEDDKAEGPDLAAGVAASDIAEGQMLAGRVGDQAVMIARSGGRLYAVGAQCTHHGAPLNEGLLVGGQVRCPWHHAHFDLATGEAVAAPAFDPLPCFAVEERDGRVFVRARKMGSKAAPAKPPPQRVVIVGGGAGGFACAEMLARRGFAGQVTLVSRDADAPYDRTACSKDYLSGESSREDCMLEGEGFGPGGVTMKLSTRVTGLDLEAKQVRLAGGETLGFDALVLAAGAEPRRPDAPGLERPNVYLLRTLKDADAVIAAAKDAQRMAVIGASFIALETAAAMIKRGLDVHLVAPEDTPLKKVLGEAIGTFVKDLHADKGVKLHLGRKVDCFDGSTLTLDDGQSIDVDFIVAGVGVAPRGDLAEDAGLKVEKGAVVVDANLQTSVPGVYAIGDLALYPDPVTGEPIRVEHWVHAQRQGQYVARRLTGAEGLFRDAPFFWSAHYDTTIAYVGHAEDFNAVEIDGDLKAAKFVARFLRHGRALATAGSELAEPVLEASVALEREAGATPGAG